MKIAFKLLKSGSGSDIYFERLSKVLKKNGFKTEIFYYHRYFQFFPILLKLFNGKRNYDIVHSNAECGWVFKRKDIPLIVTVFHLVYDKEYQKTTSLFQKIYHYLLLKPNMQKTLDSADKVIAISKYTKKSINNYFKTRKEISVIYCGIDFSIFKPAKFKKYNDNKFHLLFVGNLIKRKGVDLLPKIMKLLGNNYVLHYTSGLRTKPPNNFDLPNMIPLGRLSEEELVSMYNKCNVLLAPSRLEGFGYQVAEAMACGKPAIATNRSSSPELIINNKGGFLCEIDNVKDFVEKIKVLSENKYLMKKMGQFNRQRILDKFNLEKMRKKYQQLYYELLKI